MLRLRGSPQPDHDRACGSRRALAGAPRLARRGPLQEGVEWSSISPRTASSSASDPLSHAGVHEPAHQRERRARGQAGADLGDHRASAASPTRAGAVRSGPPCNPGAGCWSRCETQAPAWTRRPKSRIFEPFYSTKAAVTGSGSSPVSASSKLTAARSSWTARPGTSAARSRCSCAPGRRSGRKSVSVSAPLADVLVVDDEPLVRSLVRLLLAQHGYGRGRRKRHRRA